MMGRNLEDIIKSLPKERQERIKALSAQKIEDMIAHAEKLDAANEKIRELRARIVELEAALAAPWTAGKPIAWQERQQKTRTGWTDWYECSIRNPPDSKIIDGILFQWRPVYARLTAAEQAEENYHVSQIREGHLHGIKMALEDLKRGYINGAQLRLMSILENAHKL